MVYKMQSSSLFLDFAPLLYYMHTHTFLARFPFGSRRTSAFERRHAAPSVLAGRVTKGWKRERENYDDVVCREILLKGGMKGRRENGALWKRFGAGLEKEEKVHTTQEGKAELALAAGKMEVWKRSEEEGPRLKAVRGESRERGREGGLGDN